MVTYSGSVRPWFELRCSGCHNWTASQLVTSAPSRQKCSPSGAGANFSSSWRLVAPGDLAGQARQTFANVGRALAAAGARPNQVTKITTYIVGYKPEYRTLVADPRTALFGDHRPASTLVGVEALARPEYLIEVEAIAVVD